MNNDIQNRGIIPIGVPSMQKGLSCSKQRLCLRQDMMNLSMYLVDTPVRDILVGDAPPRDAPDGDRYSIETSAYRVRLTIAQ